MSSLLDLNNPASADADNQGVGQDLIPRATSGAGSGGGAPAGGVPAVNGAPGGLGSALMNALAVGLAGFAPTASGFQNQMVKRVGEQQDREMELFRMAEIGKGMGEVNQHMARGDLGKANAAYRALLQMPGAAGVPQVWALGKDIQTRAFEAQQKVKLATLLGQRFQPLGPGHPLWSPGTPGTPETTTEVQGPPAQQGPPLPTMEPGPPSIADAIRSEPQQSLEPATGPQPVGPQPGQTVTTPGTPGTPATTGMIDRRDQVFQALVAQGLMKPDEAEKLLWPEQKLVDGPLGSKWSWNPRTDTLKLKFNGTLNMKPGETVSSVDFNNIGPDGQPRITQIASGPSRVTLTDEEKHGVAALGDKVDIVKLEADLNSPDPAVRALAASWRPELLKVGQGAVASPKTDIEDARAAIALGYGAKPYLNDYSQDQMREMVAWSQKQKADLVRTGTDQRLTTADQMEQQKGWRDAYNGKHGKEVLFNITTGDRVQDNRPYSQVSKGLGTQFALLDPEAAKMVTFSQRGQRVIDALADILPKLLASGKIRPGDNLLRALEVAAQAKLLPTETIGEFKSVAAMAKFDIASVESRSARILATQLKQVGDDQIPGLTDTVESARGKLRPAKWGLIDVEKSAFGLPRPRMEDVPIGTPPTFTGPSGNRIPIMR